jgi:hypothetical protein
MRKFLVLSTSVLALTLAACAKEQPEAKIDFSELKDVDGKKVDENTAKGAYVKTKSAQPENRLAREIYLRARMKQRKNLPLNDVEKEALKRDLSVSKEDKEKFSRSNRITVKSPN